MLLASIISILTAESTIAYGDTKNMWIDKASTLCKQQYYTKKSSNSNEVKLMSDTKYFLTINYDYDECMKHHLAFMNQYQPQDKCEYWVGLIINLRGHIMAPNAEDRYWDQIEHTPYDVTKNGFGRGPLYTDIYNAVKSVSNSCNMDLYDGFKSFYIKKFMPCTLDAWGICLWR